MVISSSWLRASRENQVGVERLGETGVGDRCGNALRRKHVRRLQAFAEPRAERQQRDGVAFADDAAAADLERHAALGQRDADAVAARIAQGGRPVVDRRRGRHHVHELGFVGRRHDHEAGQAAEIGEVERAGMGRAVGADEAGAIDGEAHRQALDRDVVHDLVVGALQEGRIDRGERLEALRRQARGEGHAMLLGDADVEGALREAPCRKCRRRCRPASRR